VWGNHTLEGLRTSEVLALVQVLAANTGMGIEFVQSVSRFSEALGVRISASLNYMRTIGCRPSDGFESLTRLIPSMWWYRCPVPGQARISRVISAPMPASCVENGIRVETDDPNNFTRDTTGWFDDAGALVVPNNGSNNMRTRVSRDMRVMGPPNIPAAGAPFIARNVANNFFRSVMAYSGRAAKFISRQSKLLIRLNKLSRDLKAGGAITFEMLVTVNKSDMHGNAYVPASMLVDKVGGVKVVKNNQDF
jgi:hypothetical protein